MGYGGGGKGRFYIYRYIYLSLHCHHQNDYSIKTGSDESHFNVSVKSDGHSHRTVSTNHNLSEEKGEPKRHGTEVRSFPTPNTPISLYADREAWPRAKTELGEKTPPGAGMVRAPDS